MLPFLFSLPDSDKTNHLTVYLAQDGSPHIYPIEAWAEMYPAQGVTLCNI